MSKSSAAKKARRKRRLAARNDRWLPDEVQQNVEGVRRIANEIGPRGWEFDPDYSTEEFITWYYPPSALEVDEGDDVTESITRIWVTHPDELHVIFAGSDVATSNDHYFPVAELSAKLPTIEAYRAGGPLPDLG